MPIGGACFSVTDANGSAQSACTDESGIANVYALAPGSASVVQTSTPDGYNSSAPAYGTIEVGSVSTVKMINTAIPVQIAQEPPPPPPTETPTPEPPATETPTVAPPAADTPTQEPAATETPTQVPAASESPTQEPSATETPTVAPSETASATATTGPDKDGDGVPDSIDNCLNVANPDQIDANKDGKGAACDKKDGDGTPVASPSAKTAGFSAAAVQPPSAGDFSIKLSAIGTDGKEVSSLQPYKDLQCGVAIPFLDTISVKNSNNTGDASIIIVNNFAETTTNGGLVGFLPASIQSVTVSGGSGNETVSYVISSSGGNTVVTSTVTGLTYGETVVVTIMAAPICRNTSAVGDTIQINIPSASVVGGGSISVGNQTDPMSADNVIQPFIGVTKSCPTVTSGPAGTVIQYPVSVTNSGNIALTLTFTESRSGTFSPALSGTIAAGATRSFTFSYTVQAGDTNADNSITVPGGYTVGGINKSVSSTNSVTCPFTVTTPQIVITKTADNGSVNAGDPIGFTITVKNTGNAPTSTNVAFSDPLPSGTGVTWTESPDQALCSISSGTLTCSGISLAANAQFSVHVTSPTTSQSCKTYNNTATITAGGTGSASASVIVNCPNLTIVKTADNSTVSAGDQIGYTITLTNIGEGIARSVVLSDTLPTGTGISWSVAAGSSPNCTITGNTLTCAPRDLTGSESITVHVTSPTTAASCATINNRASYSATNAASGQTALVPIVINCPSLTITKVADAATVNAGEQIGYTITVINTGPGTAKDVHLTDTLPTAPGISWTIASSSPNCAIAGGNALDCAARDLTSGQSITVHVTSPTTPASCVKLDNTAAYTTTLDPVGKSASASVTVQCPDVPITKTAGNGTINAGQTASFTITVKNLGPGVAKGVTISDPLPGGLAWTDNSASCTITTGTLNCTVGDLADQATFTVTVSAPTTFEDCGQLQTRPRSPPPTSRPEPSATTRRPPTSPSTAPA